MVKLKLSFAGEPEVVRRVGKLPGLQIPVVIEFKGKGDFIIPYFAYEVTLYSVPNYGSGLGSLAKKRIFLGRFKYDNFIEARETELIFEFPIYPEVVEEMNKISAEDEYIAFLITVSDGLIYWTKSSPHNRGKLVEGISIIYPSVAEMAYKDNTVGLISFSREELAKLFSGLEETEYEWLTVPIPKIEVEGVDENIKEDIKTAIRSLKSARKVLHTPEYGQAMIDLRIIRDMIGNYSKDAGGYTLKTELGKIVEKKASDNIKSALNQTLRGVAAITNKYVHEDRNELKENPPWRETKFAYSLMAYLCWYLSNILTKPKH